jgi:hypothetical protein
VVRESYGYGSGRITFGSGKVMIVVRGGLQLWFGEIYCSG